MLFFLVGFYGFRRKESCIIFLQGWQGGTVGKCLYSWIQDKVFDIA